MPHPKPAANRLVPTIHLKSLRNNVPTKRWTDADGVHIDVRGLAPPAPLLAIIALVESLDAATAVIVHHDRDPVMLYGELAERGWSAERIDAGPGEIRLRLERLP